MGSLVLAHKPEPQGGPVDYSAADAVSDSAADYGAQLDEASGAFYRIPQGYDAESTRKYPLLVYLHGSNVLGFITDLTYIGLGYTSTALTTQIDQAAGDAFRLARHCFVLMPQTEASVWDIPTLEALIDDFIATWPVDENRIYAHGWSMGGSGCRGLAVAREAAGKPLAAIVNITGSLTSSLGDVWAKTSVWSGCGGLDNAPRPALIAGIYAEGAAYWPAATETTQSRTRSSETENIKELTLGGMVINRLVEWPNMDHGTRTIALSDPDLIDWTFSQSLTNHP